MAGTYSERVSKAIESFQRLGGGAVKQMPNRQGRLLVGDGPAFLNFEAACSSFFYGAPPSNLASQQRP